MSFSIVLIGITLMTYSFFYLGLSQSVANRRDCFCHDNVGL